MKILIRSYKLHRLRKQRSQHKDAILLQQVEITRRKMQLYLLEAAAIQEEIDNRFNLITV